MNLIISFFSIKTFISVFQNILIFLFITFAGRIGAQIFPGLNGDILVEAIRNEYTPAILLNDTQVKDSLYANIFIESDSVRCIYSGLSRFLPEDVDPSQFLFGSGNETGSINLEHAWPQSKGAGEGTDGNMNMHHLYPSRVSINSDRADHPFAQIDDNLTDKWYYLAIELFSKPQTGINAYSEFVQGSFEPRESVKGDIARAMFYFWTIYRQDAELADPGFFDLMKEDICQWHEQDPADSFENERNVRIASHQDGKINPFITDCTLVKRAYCSSIPECTITTVPQVEITRDIIFIDQGDLRYKVFSGDQVEWIVFVVNVFGQIIFNERIESDQWSSLPEANPGIYFIHGVSGNQVVLSRIFIH